MGESPIGPEVIERPIGGPLATKDDWQSARRYTASRLIEYNDDMADLIRAVTNKLDG